MMFLLDTTAAAGGGAGTKGSGWVTILMLVAMLAIFYLFLVRPQKKQEKKIAEMRSSLEVGDEITTVGGIMGTVIIIKDDKIMIETGNDKTKLTLLRSAIKSIDSKASE